MDANVQNFLNGPFALVIFAWTIVWKGIALWRAARNEQKYWFVGILIINTLGLLEIVYLLFFQTNGKYGKMIKAKLISLSPISLSKK